MTDLTAAIPPEPAAPEPAAIETIDPDRLMFGKKACAYVCTGCGIAEAIDTDRLVEVARGKDVPAKVHGPLCVPDGVEFLRRDLADQQAGRAVIAACSQRVNWDVFSPESLGVELVERVNIRELVAWSKPPGEEETQLLAGDYLRMGIARSEKIAPPPPKPVEVAGTLLVVGGGVAGLTAALESAQAGSEVVLVERAEQLGGWMATFRATFPTAAPFNEGLQEIEVGALVERVRAHPRIVVRTGTTLRSVEGMPGDYSVTLANGAGEEGLRAGAIVLATGWQPAIDEQRLARYGFGSDPDVITNVAFEELAASDLLRRPSDGQPVRRVAFLQRPAASEEEKAFSYGAHVVDLVSLKQALYVRALDPQAQAYIFYEGMVTPGLYESFYRRVQQEPGVLFTKGEVLGVERRDGELLVEVTATLLGSAVSLPVDLVVLATGMAPSTADGDEGGPLHLLYRQGPGLPSERFGFANSNFLCFPYETQRTGIYAAGAVREPMDAAFSAEDATGAALKAIQSLSLVSSGRAVHPRAGDLSLPHTRTAGCTRCGRCSIECPFSAIELNEKQYPVLNPTRCRRCGICMGACPVRVISFEDYSVEQLTAMVRAVEFPEDESIPRVMVMCCENDAYPAFDQAGIHRLSFSAAVRVMPLRCLGSLNVAVVADALSGGVDGIMLMGCRTGADYQCHFIRGSELAQRRMSNLQETLGRLMLEPERVSVNEVEISDYRKLPGMIDSFVEQIEAMGPNPYKGF
jgi:quinone-modifying oxidoreductase subunit QmoB